MSGAVFGQKMHSPKVQIESFSIEQGLSDRNVNFLTKDQQGFIWIATDNGLNRFDGYDFLNYDCRPQNKHQLRFNKVNALIPDRGGNLIVRYEQPFEELDLIHPMTGEVTKFNFDQSAGFTGKNEAYFQAPDGSIYFFTLPKESGKGQIIYQYDEKTHQCVKVFEVNHPHVNPTCFVRFLKASDGTFWFAYTWGGVFDTMVVHTDAAGRTIRVYSVQDFSLEHGSISGWVALTETANREILLTLSRQGVYVLDTSATGVCKRHPLLPPAGFFLTQDKKGNLLAYQTEPADPTKGCYLMTAGGQLVNYSWVFTHQSIIEEVFSDDFTEGFLAGTGNGFNNYQLRPGRFKTILDQELGNAPYGISIRGMAKLGSHQLFIATEVDGMRELDLRTNVLSRPGDRLPGLALLNELRYPRNLVPQGDSVLWASAIGGVLKYKPSQNTVQWYSTQSADPVASASEVWGIAVAERGLIWLIRRDGALLMLDPASGQMSVYRSKDGSQPLAESQPSFLLLARDGTLWVGTTLAGLIHIDPKTGTSQRYAADPAGFNSTHITCIYEDASGLLWVGTMEGGLHVFNPRTGRVEAIYSRENGLRNNSTVGILPDAKGNFWVSTFSGLSYFDTKLKTFRNYTTADGLSHNEFNRFSYLFDPEYGRFYFGGMNGVNVFDQNDRQATENDAPLLIAEMSVTGKNDKAVVRTDGLIDGATIVLEPGSRFLQLRLALGTDYNANANQFSYKIDGLSTDWNYLGTNRNLRIDNLPAGDYVLHLRGADERGNWSSREIALHLIVQEFWYKTWWAYLLYVALIAAAAFYFYRFQLRRSLAEKETQRLQQLDACETRFFTNISHEFRTPLTVILGMVDSLKKHFDKKAAPEHEQAAELIRRNSRNLLNLVNQLLDLARLESGKLQLSPANGDLAAFLNYQLESFQSYAETRRIGLHFHSDVPHLEMAFDHEKVQTILVNLISNAIKFTPEGGQVSVELRIENLELNPRRPSILNSQFSIIVSDTGIGIPEEQLGRVFDRFYQVDDSMTRRGEGTGIGLALVQELVKLMQGTIAVESQLGQGTSFRINLPYTPPLSELDVSTPAPTGGEAQQPVTTSQSAPRLPSQLGEGSGLGLTAEDDPRPLLLIVEDNPDVRFYIAECVRQEYRVALADNGSEGIQQAMEMVPDIIISDVMMPEKDGFELCETLKNDPVTSHIPIVLLTARADFESRIAGLRRGADDYLAKPFEPVELQVRLENLVKLRRRLQQRYAAMPFQPEVSDDPALVLEDVFLLKIRDVVEARLSEADFDMPQLEQALGMSRSQVFRKVKALTGASPSVLVRHIRLNRAKEMLRDHSRTIAEIAYDVGFSTPAYFSTTFLEAFGKTPSEWRTTTTMGHGSNG